MNSFLFKELLRTLLTNGRALLWELGALLTSAVALLGLALLVVATSDRGESRLMVLFQPGVPYARIRQIYQQVLKWEAVSEVSYILRDDPRLAQDGVDPDLASAGYLRVTARRAAEAVEIEAALRDLPGVASVQSYQKGTLRTALSSEGGAQTIVIVIAIGAALAALIMVFLALRALATAWAGELETLYLSGLPSPAIRWPFFGVAVLGTLVSAALAMVFLLLLQDAGAVRVWLPELLQPGGTGYASLWVLGLALTGGAVAGLLGAWTIRLKF